MKKVHHFIFNLKNYELIFLEKFCKQFNSFYPRLDMGTIMNTMSKLNNESRNVSLIKDQGNWKDIYSLIKTTRLRYRAKLSDCKKSFNFVHKLSHEKIDCLIFN
ncbi:MAG: hypothetical protein ACOC3V_00255 [bacterium]